MTQLLSLQIDVDRWLSQFHLVNLQHQAVFQLCWEFTNFLARLRGKLYLKQQTASKDIVLFIFIDLQYHDSKFYHFLTFSQALQYKKLLRNISSATLSLFSMWKGKVCPNFRIFLSCGVFRVVGSMLIWHLERSTFCMLVLAKFSSGSSKHAH